MKYHATIEIDDDRWAKHPYSIRIKDEDGNEVSYMNYLDDRDECYRISDRYGISQSEIKEEFY